ncbi:MAG: hypothetical protein FWB78_12445, partial [Treponema sp.]|nr:hypothetical protein [Treponema sp.]
NLALWYVPDELQGQVKGALGGNKRYDAEEDADQGNAKYKTFERALRTDNTLSITIEVKNQKTLNLLRELESLGLIRAQSPSSLKTAKTVKTVKAVVRKNNHSNQWSRESDKNLPGRSEDDIFAFLPTDEHGNLL